MKKAIKNKINPFSTDVPLTQKPGSWFLLAKMFEKHKQKPTTWFIQSFYFKKGLLENWA